MSAFDPVDDDCDQDGLPDFYEGTIDSDSDGVQDQCDLDSDNDGIRDDVEGAGDFDDDGIPNYLDRDSDDDGIPDAIEFNRGVIRAEYVAADGNLSGADADNDGIIDSIELPSNQLPTPYNSDNDDNPDYLDLDSDNDGILDIREAGGTADTDGDGQVDNPTDANNNGYADALETTPLSIPNTDSAYETTEGLTLLPNYIDIDSDNDGIDDTREGQSTSGYGFPTILTDVDEDGIIDFWDVSSDLNPIIPFDNDFDGTPDYIDLDSDNDGEGDIIEGNDADFNGVADTVPLDVDANGNGLDDAFDAGCVATNPSSTFSTTQRSEEDNSDGDIDTGSSDIEFVNDGGDNQTIGIRFTNVTIAQGADIGNAYVQFQADADESGAVTIKIEGQLSTNAASFNTTDFNVSGRTRTVEFDNWSPPAWSNSDAGANQRTVNIADIIEEIVGQGGWSSGNSIVLIFTGANGQAGIRRAENNVDLVISLVGGASLVCSSNVSLPDEDSDDEYDFRETDVVDSDFDGVSDDIDIDDDNDGITDIDEGCANVTVSAGNGTSAIEVEARVEDEADGIDGVNGNYARFRDDGATMDVTLRGGEIVPIGINITVRAQKRDNGANTMTISESVDGVSFVNPETFTFSERRVYQDKIYALTTDATHIRIVYNRDVGDLRVDNISYAGFTAYICRDSDGDGIVDRLDLDSDNDGVLDITEVGGSAFDADNNGRVDNYIEGNGPDGLASVFEPLAGNSSNLPNLDTDNDGFKDYIDLDSDNDGIYDIIEAGGQDLNSDGSVDNTTDGDNDGIANTFDINNGGNPLADPDLDDDGFPNRVDIDSDGDGIVDVIESQASSGSPVLPTGNDTDNDGIDNAFDSNNGGTPTVSVDTDGDGTPDYLDINSDNDGLVDAVEGWDTNGDSSPNTTPAGTDTDGDGLDNNYDTINGRNSTTNVYDSPGGDNSSDDYPDETTPATTERDWREANIIDTDLDGIPDSDDIDDDNDGVLDINEANCASIPASLTNSLNYRFFDGEYTPTVDNIPNTGSIGSGTITDFNVGSLQASVDPGDADDYGIKYSGFIKISTSEIYTFFTSSDDGSKLFINGIEVVDNDGDHGITEEEGDITLTPGIYGFEVLFYENGGGASLSVSYETSTITKVGIPFSVFTAQADCDTDGDGIVDRLDLDSDNDGIFDIIEAGGVDTNTDGRVDVFVDGNSNGWANVFDPGNGGTVLSDPDTDGDGLKNKIDIDSDGDGITDLVESQGTTDSPVKPLGIDSDQDGIDNAFDINCATCGSVTGVPTVPVNTDAGFGTSDLIPDYLDTDSDNDGLGDIIEGWDTNGNYAANVTPLGTDADGDGLDDAFDNVVAPNSITNPTNTQTANSFPNITTAGATTERDWRESNNVTCAPGEVDGNLMLWLRADRGGTNWLDQSNNYVSLTRTGTATAGTMNFNPTNNFNGSTYYTADLSINSGANPDLVVIAVYRPNTDDAGAVWGENNGSFDRYMQDASGQNNAVSSGSGTENNIAGLFTNGVPTLSSVIFDEDAGNGSQVFVNGKVETSFTANHGSETSNNLQIAALGTGMNRFNGQIAEIIVYNQLLSTGNDRQKIESYLALKYGITLSSNTDGDATAFEAGEGDYIASTGLIFWDASDNTGFHNNVAGIVRDDASCLNQLQSQSVNSTSIVTMGLDADTDGLEASNAQNSSTFTTNLSAAIWGHDGADLYDSDNRDFNTADGINSRLNREWRVQETGTVGSVLIKFDVSNLMGPDENLGTNDEADIFLLVDADGDFTSGASVVAQSFVVAADGSVSFTLDLPDGAYFTLASGEQYALPITLLSFNGASNDDHIELNWTTASEINNSLFRVDRSADGINFETVGYVDGAGTTEDSNTYVLRDENPLVGKNYYRLIDIDNNGVQNASELILVNYFKEVSLDLKPYPNPIKKGGIIYLNIDQEAVIDGVKLYEMNGTEVKVNTERMTDKLAIKPALTNQGVYLLKVFINGELRRFKILVKN